jgi:hypothetical protein
MGCDGIFPKLLLWRYIGTSCNYPSKPVTDGNPSPLESVCRRNFDTATRATGTMSTAKRATGHYCEPNELCARLIASSPATYGGAGSLVLRWAEGVLARAEASPRTEGLL